MDQTATARNAFFYSLTALITIGCIAAIIGCVALIGAKPDLGGNTIVVEGTAKKLVSPDIATFSYTLHAKDKDVTKAQTKVSEQSEKLKAELLALGIKEEDIKTQNISSNEHFEWKNGPCDARGYCPQEQVSDGFEVFQNDMITLRDLDLASKVIASLAKADVQNMWGPNFEVDDMDKFKTEIRQEAIKKAKDQAGILSKDLGVRITKLVNFSESNNGEYPVPMMSSREGYAVGGAAMDMAMAPMVEEQKSMNISVGQNEISTTVYLTYKIK